jgi:hypothetical protein
MHHAFDEIEHRSVLFEALEVIIKDKFIITPASPHKRIRRNDVHAAVLGTLNPKSGGGNPYFKRLVGEKLKQLGAGKILSTGRRWFTNIEFKHE